MENTRFDRTILSTILALIIFGTGLFAPIAAEVQSTPDSEPVLENLPRFVLPSAGVLPLKEGAEPAKSPAKAEKTDSAGQDSGANATKNATSSAATSPGVNLNKNSATQSTVRAASVAISSAEPVPLASIYRGTQAVPQEVVLPNGLKVLILENHEFPVVSTLVWYRVGSRNEEIGSTGLGHIVEHLMFQQVGQFKSGEIGSTIARLGGQFNGYTSDDFTTFFETLPSARLELALKIEADRMSRTVFAEQDLKQEIANVQKEFENEARDPAAILSKDMRAALFEKHPYHNPTIGWKSDVDGLTIAKAREFYQKYFRPDNATLVISGDLNGKNVLALVQKYFAALPGSGKPQSRPVIEEPFLRSEKRVNLKYSGNKEVMQFAYRAPAMDDADAPVMVVIERLLNGGNAGRLRSRLVDSKICSYSQANYEIKKDASLFTITCSALAASSNPQSKINETVDALINQLRDKGPSEPELRKARNQAEFAYYSECDGPYRAGFHLGYFESLDKWQNSYTWAERLKSVNSQDVVRVARKYFAPETRVLGWIAGNSAPKPAPSKPAQPASEVKEKEKNSNSKHIEHVRLTGFKDDDESPSSKVRDKKNVLPPVIREIPTALGNAVTGNIPGAVGNVGNAIIGIPGAITGIGNGIGTAVGNTASALGKQIAQLKTGSESGERIARRVLKNGVTVLVFESHISPVVQIAGSVQAGEAYAPRNKPGYSLLASSILNQGSNKTSRTQMSAMQDEFGISAAHMLRFDPGLETIDFSARCLSRDFASELNLIAEALSQPSIDEANLEKAKQEASAQLKRHEDGINQKVERVLLQNLLDENSPFCPPDPSLKLKSIGQSSLGELQKFFDSHIVPSAATVVVVGDVQAEQVFAQAESSFSQWTNKANHPTMHARARAARVLRASIPIKDSKKSTVCFGQILPISESHPEYGNLLVADGILANHPMVSRFEKALSKNPSLENAIGNGDFTIKIQPLSNMTCWSMALAVDPTLVPVTVKTIKTELKQLSHAGVDSQEFSEVKRYLLGSLAVRKQSTLGSVADQIVESAEHSDTIYGFNSLLNSLKNSSVESVNRLIRGTFRPELSTVVIAGGGQSIKAVRTQDSKPASP